MRPPAPRELLDAWERGLNQPPIVRALLLLAEAFPEQTVGELAELSIGERNRRLLDLREALFGARLTALARCPSCGEQLEAVLTTRQVRFEAAPETEPRRCDVDGYSVEFRLPTSNDLVAVLSAPPSEERAKLLLGRCLLHVRNDGDDASESVLPDHVVREIGRHIAAADPQSDVEFEYLCTLCERPWNAPFDIVRFLWQELDAWAERILRDVANLARAFGWREADVLSLSPTRRRIYLELSGA